MNSCPASPRLLKHKFKPHARPPRAGAGFDVPTSLVGKTPDGRCAVYYDPATGSQGLKNAQDVLGWAPQIVRWHDQVFGTTGGTHNLIVCDLSSGAHDGSGGAYHYGCDFSSGADLYCDCAYGNSALVAGLYAAELSEAYMGAGQNPAPWGCGFSNGEGLSRRCADEVVALVGFPGAMDGYSAANSWDTADDWISKTESTDGNYDSIGAAVLFIDWMIKNGSPLYKIAQAPGSTCAAAYAALTGDAPYNAYPKLKAAVSGLSGHGNDFPFTGGANPGGAVPGGAPPPPPPPNPNPQPPTPYPSKAQWDAECQRLIDKYPRLKPFIAFTQKLGDGDLTAASLSPLSVLQTLLADAPEFLTVAQAVEAIIGSFGGRG